MNPIVKQINLPSTADTALSSARLRSKVRPSCRYTATSSSNKWKVVTTAVSLGSVQSASILATITAELVIEKATCVSHRCRRSIAADVGNTHHGQSYSQGRYGSDKNSFGTRISLDHIIQRHVL